MDYVSLLPHRPPFLFVDAVHEVEPGSAARCSYTVTGDEAFLAGHFPNNPIFPGVLQLEALAQVGAVAVLADERFSGKLPLFGGAENVRWRRVVRPDDTMEMQIAIERLSTRGGWGQGRVTVAGQVACQARIMFAFG